jgi:hypothetical protein
MFGSERGKGRRRDWSDSGRYDWTNTRRADWPHLYRSGAHGHVYTVDAGALAFSPGTTVFHYAKRHDQRDVDVEGMPKRVEHPFLFRAPEFSPERSGGAARRGLQA